MLENRNLSALRDACRTLLSESYHEFWVLAGLTDRSYEDGVKKAMFSKEVALYEEAGIRPALLDQLRNGINGNLKVILEGNPNLSEVVRRPGKGQDLTFVDRETQRVARVEGKFIFDCTFEKHYSSTASDWDKLAAVRESSENDLFTAVFFNTMPYYDHWPNRSENVVRVGIPAQFVNLTQRLKIPPAWPSNGPHIVKLNAPSDEVAYGLCQRWPSIAPWRSDLKPYLRYAAVGVAIWQLPS